MRAASDALDRTVGPFLRVASIEASGGYFERPAGERRELDEWLSTFPDVRKSLVPLVRERDRPCSVAFGCRVAVGLLLAGRPHDPRDTIMELAAIIRAMPSPQTDLGPWLTKAQATLVEDGSDDVLTSLLERVIR